MSQIFVYICTKTTADPFLPPRTTSVDVLSRDVSDAFAALAGGHYTVGKLAFFPQQRSVPNHLLCDGREVAKVSFPELYGYLGDAEGTAGPDSFRLPNFLTGLDAAVTATTESASTGTVSTPAPEVPPPGEYPERTDRFYGDVDSGGRFRNPAALDSIDE